MDVIGASTQLCFTSDKSTRDRVEEATADTFLFRWCRRQSADTAKSGFVSVKADTALPCGTRDSNFDGRLGELQRLGAYWRRYRDRGLSNNIVSLPFGNCN